MNWADAVFELYQSSFERVLFPANSIILELSLEFTEPELCALLILDRHGQMTMSQASSMISIAMSTATGIVDRLVRRGLMKRERDESDRRAVYIQLTEEGERICGLITRQVKQEIGDVEKTLTETEKETVMKVLVKYFEVKSKMSQSAAPNLASGGGQRSIPIK